MKRKQYEKIYHYLNGKMDEQEAICFEQELKNDRALAKEFRLVSELKEMAKRFDRLELIELIKQARENYYQEKEKAKQ